MDYEEELRGERATLVRADVDIRLGEKRLMRQERTVLKLRAHNYDTAEAERLAEMFGETLHHWRRHRELILIRIAHLESQLRSRGGSF